MGDLAVLRDVFFTKLSGIDNLDALMQLRVEFLGKKGAISEEMKKLAAMELSIRKDFGAAVNSMRDFIVEALEQKHSILTSQALEFKLREESIDITMPGRAQIRGKVHPIAQVIDEVQSIFSHMGFASVEGPDIEDDWHNFTGLNIPQMHPARQMHDTFYIENHDPDLVLRTHTSSVQIRYMADHKPPVKILSLGKVYRSDFDATHTPMFHQIEGLCIGKEINIGHLKWSISEFLQTYFGLKHVPMRFRASYFPFTEPSIEVDIQCDRSNKNEIIIGQGSDWMEIMGCGMVHANVLKNMHINPDEYQGFAFGMGIERIAMLKYNIPDLRHFFEGDMRWLSRYGF